MEMNNNLLSHRVLLLAMSPGVAFARWKDLQPYIRDLVKSISLNCIKLVIGYMPCTPVM